MLQMRSLKDLSTRCVMVSLDEEKMTLEFDFLSSGPSQSASSSHMPSRLELATAKASLRHFLNMNLNALGAVEKAITLSVVSILKTSSEFFQSSKFGTLDTLSLIFTALQDSSSICSYALIRLGNSKHKKKNQMT